MDRFTRVVDYINPHGGLSYGEIPGKIIELNKLQVISMIAAILHGKKSPYFGPILEPARSKTPPTPERTALLFAGSSMLYDFDDFMFAGHTGHSSVIVPLCFAARHAIDGKNFLTLQTMGNELGGRLGASIFFGPMNGQLWTPIHQLISASILARLKAEKISGGAGRLIGGIVSLSLSFPVLGLWDVFFSSSAKACTALFPLQAGMRAAELGGETIKGPDHFTTGGNFYSYSSYMPILQVFDTLGDVYYSHSLSYKKYPGCAYITSSVEACEKIRAVMQKDGIPFSEIESAKIYCNILSKKMDEMSRPYLMGKDSTLTTLNFSLPVNCALMLRDGCLRPESFSPASLDSPATWELAEKISVHHDALETARMLKHSSYVPDSTGLFLRHPLKLRPYMKRYGTFREILSLPAGFMNGMKVKKYKPVERQSGENFYLFNGTTVVVRLKNKKTLAQYVGLPSGFAGTGSAQMKDTVYEKLKAACGPRDYDYFVSAIEGLEKFNAKDINGLKEKIYKLLLK